MSVVSRDEFRNLRNLVPDQDLAEQLFRIRYKYAVSHSRGMERLAFATLPYALLKSFVLTLDPQEAFLLGAWRITAANRTVTQTTKALTNIRKIVGNGFSESRGNAKHGGTCQWLGDPYGPSSSYPITGALTNAPDYERTRKDTTRRTRPPGSDQGEFECFTYSLAVPERTVSWTSKNQVRNTSSVCPGGYSAWDDIFRSEDFGTVGGCAIFTSASMVTLRSQVLASTNSAITTKLPSMVANLLPSARRYSIARNIIELRDMPRSVLNLASTLYDLRSAFAAMPRGVSDAVMRAKLPEHVPDGWLSFWFSWRQTYKDLVDLLEAPAKISKDINFLIMRKGRPTTIRTKRNFAGSGSTTPAFTFNPSTLSTVRVADNLLSSGTRHTWEHEVRLVLNLVFDFPEVGVPKLRKALFLRKMGFTITPTDVYNLIPWTWLVDWFTGLGSYVEMIDNINTDKSLINWGLVTGVTTGRVITEGTCQYTNTAIMSTRHDGNTPVITTTLTPVKRVITCELDYKCTVRKDAGSMLGVARTVEPSTLSTYQQSIIGAIVARRSV